jgi:regulatory protein
VDAYTQALTWLARRELSERQVRDRLAKREYEDDAIAEAVERLKTERALDDRRVALACARSAVRLKGRGRERVRRAIESLGISRDLARAAVDEVFTEIDESALIDRALEKRWPRVLASAPAPDAVRRELQRIYQALVRQGFPPDRVMHAIKARKANASSRAMDDDE